MEFVFNEWFLEWHKPDATVEEKRKVKLVFDWFRASEHRVVILLHSRFIKKLNDFRRAYNTGFGGNELKEIASGIATNREKYRRLEIPPELPPEIEELLRRPSENPLTNVESDRFLFEAAETTDEKIIVTTDQKLINHFSSNERFQLWTVDEFIAHFNIT